MADRFLIPPLPAVADPAATHAALDTAFGAAQAGLNTLGDEAALSHLMLHGIGRIENQGCRLSIGEDGVLRLSNGFFLAGAGVGDDDESYFPGARLVRVNGEDGYIELTGEDAPPVAQTSLGYMSALGDVLWLEEASESTDNRWLIGQVTADVAGTLSDASDRNADVVYLPSGAPENPEEPTGEVTREEFTALKTRVTNLETALADAIAELRALIPGNGEAFPDDLTVLADNVAVIMAGLMEVNPHAIERAQMSVVVKQSGHGQDDTPDFSPDTNADNELPYDAETGLFGPFPA